MFEQYLLNLDPCLILIDKCRIEDRGLGQVGVAQVEMLAC